MDSLKEQLKALKEKRARLLAEIAEEIRLVELKIAEEASSKKDNRDAERRSRDEQILKMRAEGKTFALIGATFGVSGGRIRDIVEKDARRKRREEFLMDRAQFYREEQERRDKERTITIVVTRPISVDGEHMAEGAQVRVTPLVAGQAVKANRANFATEADYEAFVAAVKGEAK